MNTPAFFVRVIAITVLSLVATFLLIDIEQARAQSVVTPHALTAALIRVGLTPESLTAAGLSSAQTNSVVDEVNSHLAENVGVLSEADSTYASARTEHERLQRLIQSGVYAQTDLSAYATAVSSLNAAQTQRHTALNNIWAAGTADLSEAQTTVLSKIRSNSVWELPIEFLTVDRTEAQWVALREALTNERISAERNEIADSDSQALLTQARSASTVSAAIANLSANMTSVQSTWNSAITD